MPPKKVKRSAASSDVKGSSTLTRTRKAGAEGKGGKNSRGRGRGGLENMLEMPTDVVHEILRLLHPRDLLSLSWSSKSIHAFLMRKSSAYVWKECLKNVKGLPPRPDHIIGPAWASLLFSTHCTACGTGNVALTDTLWEFNARFCKDCLRSHIATVEYGFQDRRKTFAKIPIDMLNRCRTTGQRRAQNENICLKSEVERTMDTWETLVQAKDEHELALFIGTEILRVRKVAECASLCYDWAYMQAQLREDKRADMAAERLDEIKSRLCALGWKTEIDYIVKNEYQPFYRHKHVRAARKLTDRIWQNMREDMVKCMEEVREKRLALELTQRLKGRWDVMKNALLDLLQTQGALIYGLRLGDIALIPEFREIVCAPADVQVNKASFAALEAKMAAHAKQWGARVKDELLALVAACAENDEASPGASSRDGVDALALATTTFYCKHAQCHSRGLFYPGLIKHRCFHWDPPELAKSDVYGQYITKQLATWVSEQPISIKGLLVACKPSENGLHVMKLCGKDPQTATAKEMDALDVRLIREDGYSMTWRAAILWRDTYNSKGPTRLATPEEVAQAKVCEVERRKEASKYACKICNYKEYWASALRHLEVRHNIENPSIESEHLEVHLASDSPEALGVYSVKLPVVKETV